MTPFANEEDTRKVQTAVIGRAGSDMPVFLPYDHDEFDLFIQGRSREEFYCGTLLGGCGKQLSAKRYIEKKCHFAHRPPVHCRRTANGESSADHLYIGQALARWLAGQNHRHAKVSYRTVGDRPGGTVDFRLSGGRQLIRVQMARLGLHPWRQEAEALLRRADHVEWLFGPESMLAYDRVESHGYAIRVECRTVGVKREVRIGTQVPGNTIEWATLEECSLTSQGIVTPSLVSSAQGIVARGSTELRASVPPATSFLLADDTVAFTGAVQRADVQAQIGTPGSVYDADIQPLGSTVTRARIVLPHASTPLNPLRVYVLRERVTLTPVAESAKDTPAWLLTAAQTRRLDARDAAAWNGLKPPQPVPAAATPLPAERLPTPSRPKLDEIPVTISPPSSVSPMAVRSEPLRQAQRSQSRSQDAARLTSPTGLPNLQLVLALREHLKARARSGADSITWRELSSNTGFDFAALSDERRANLLFRVDEPLKGHDLMYAALVVTDDGKPLPYFPAILERHGRPVPGLQSEARQARRLEAGRIRDAYASSASRPGSAESEPAATTASVPTFAVSGPSLRPAPFTAAAPEPAGRPIDPAVSTALGTLVGLRWRFDHARQVGDLAEAKRVWQAAGKLYGSLPAGEQTKYRPRLRDMSEWVHERENENTLVEFRRLFDDLLRRQGPAAAETLSDGLARAKELKRKYHGKLPQDIRDTYSVCEERLAELLAAPSG